MANWFVLREIPERKPETFKRLPVKAVCVFWAFIMTLCLFAPPGLFTVRAEEFTGVDLILALDCSGSMERNDPDKYIVDGAKLLLDQFDKSKSRYGIVMFDGEIREVLPIQPLSDSNLIDSMKRDITDKYGWFGRTDTVRAVERALQELKSNPSNNKQVIVLFTDGYDEPVRTMEELEKARDYVVSECENLGISIYTIGLDANGSMTEDSLKKLEEMSARTDAASQTITASDEINDRILDIYNDVINSQDETEKGEWNGTPQDFIVNVPDPYILYVNMNVQSRSNIGGVRVIDPNGADVTNTDNVYIGQVQGSYMTVQIIQPIKGDWTVTMTGQEKLPYSKKLVYLYTLRIVKTISGANGGADYSEGNARIEARLATEVGNVDDMSIYDNVKKATVTVIDGKGIEYTYKAERDGDCYAADISDLPEGDYEVTAHLEHEYFTRDSFDAYKITLKPKGTQTISTTQPMTTSGTGGGTESDGWLIIALIAAAVVIIAAAAAFFILKSTGRPRGVTPIKCEFEIDIANNNGGVELFRTGGYFFDRDIKTEPLSNILRFFNVSTGTPQTDSVCGDIIFIGRKNGILFYTKRKSVTMTSSDGKIDGCPALNSETGYINISFNDDYGTYIRIRAGV